MGLVDLHAHTTVSDGTATPAELVALAQSAGLTAVAVTDHDHVAGVAPAREAARGTGVEVVAGVELSVDTPRGQLHLLGYFVDVTDARFLATIEGTRSFRGPRNDAILAKLAALGVPVTEAEVAREAALDANPGKSLGRPHIAAAMVRRGHVASVQEAFDRYLGEGKAAHVPKRKLSPAEAVRAVLDAGGVPVLAHPFTLPAEERRALVEDLARRGLGGLEVEYPKHDAALRAELAQWARELDLVATGGSDFHGTNKPDIALGTGRGGNLRVDGAALEGLRARARGV